MPVTSAENTLQIPAMESHCAQCGAEYRNIQHPLKPPGVIMRRECDCKPVYTTVPSGPNAFTTVITMVPPEK